MMDVNENEPKPKGLVARSRNMDGNELIFSLHQLALIMVCAHLQCMNGQEDSVASPGKRLSRKRKGSFMDCSRPTKRPRLNDDDTDGAGGSGGNHQMNTSTSLYQPN